MIGSRITIGSGMKLKVKVNNAPSKGKITAPNGKMTSKMIKVSFENKNAPTGQKMTYTAKVRME